MIRPAFDIVSPEYPAENRTDHHLVIEISDRLFSFVLMDAEKKELYCLRQYNFEWINKSSLSEQLEALINGDSYLQGNVKNVVVVYNYAESNLVPVGYFNIGLNKSITELVYGQAKKGLVISEKVKGWELYNVYRIPRDVHTRMQQRFAAGKYWHYYSLLLTANTQPLPEVDVCNMVFYSDRFVCHVFTHGRLQLMQTWMYETPEDVSYYLLALCTRFHFSQETLEVRVEGLIDQQSALYTELLKYFQLVSPVAIPEAMQANELLQEYPNHYFSPILKIAACV